ncbi:hypothetical protein [Sinorhizobium meliloti]|uniref:hypothetical protein n=1 Tax=Rhizobium meliloti TaxID=382 RepID=UPI0012956876|nr:hypothetical protein [Sinorhizobium meliloti]MQX70035.1 hypothetical protein [Sinorhizobium meliloti]
MTLETKFLVRDNEPLPEAFQRHHEGFSGDGFIALVIAFDGSGLLCRPAAGETTECERLSRDDMVAALVDIYGLATFRGH